MDCPIEANHASGSLEPGGITRKTGFGLGDTSAARGAASVEGLVLLCPARNKGHKLVGDRNGKIILARASKRIASGLRVSRLRPSNRHRIARAFAALRRSTLLEADALRPQARPSWNGI